MPDLNDTSALEWRLRRFLYIGKEKSEYQPGNWFVHKYYQSNNVSSIEELAQIPGKHDSIVSHIHEAQTRGLVQTVETLTFALALCAHQDKYEELRTKAYSAVRFICSSPQQFILFNKFCSELSKRKPDTKSGWGHGWRRAVKDWYDSKTPEQLAQIVTQSKGRYGWKHKDIIKLTHISATTDPAKAFVIDYIMLGHKKLKEKYADKELTESQENLMKYIDSIEEFKHCEDQVKAAALIDSLKLTLDHVPGHLLKSKEVWNSLVSSMSLTILLENLQRIHNLKFLEQSDDVIVAKVLDTLGDNANVENIHPAQFLVAVKNYENCGKPLSFEKRKVKENAKTQQPVPPKPNKKVVDALYKLLNRSLGTLPSTNVRYMVTINMNQTMQDSGCWHSGNVSAAEAGCLIALSLVKAERDVTVAVFTNSGIQCVELASNHNFAQALNQLRKYQPKTEPMVADLGKPMTWAAEQNLSIDVFINVVDQIYQKSDNSEASIKSYRSSSNQQYARLVNCAMCASSTYNKEDSDNYILTICGFDEKVPKIIEAFARSYF